MLICAIEKQLEVGIQFCSRVQHTDDVGKLKPGEQKIQGSRHEANDGG